MEVAEQNVVKLGSVVSHPLRVKILIALTERTASPAQLAREFTQNLGNVAYHFKQLEKAGAIHEVDNRPVNGSIEHLYRAIERPKMSDEESAALNPQQRLAWTRLIVEMIMADAAAAMDAGVFAERADHVVLRFPTQVDEEGWRELNEVYTRAHDEAMDIEARSAGRISEEGTEGFPVRVDTIIHEMP